MPVSVIDHSSTVPNGYHVERLLRTSDAPPRQSHFSSATRVLFYIGLGTDTRCSIRRGVFQARRRLQAEHDRARKFGIPQNEIFPSCCRLKRFRNCYLCNVLRIRVWQLIAFSLSCYCTF